MTGFGAGRATVDSEELTVEVRSVNHKFCEVKVRLPRELGMLEVPLTKVVKDRLARGAVDVSIKRQTKTGAGTVPTLDLGLAKEYRRVFSELAQALRVEDVVSLKDVASQQGVLRLEEPGVALDAATEAALQALAQALDALVKMREVEGGAMRADLAARLSTIEALAKEVATLAPAAVEEHRARLAQRILELTKGTPLDPQRLAQEVALFAERSDIAEEMTRLGSHLAQFRGFLTAQEPIGRKMDFLVQELHREVNTTGAKSQHADISTRVVTMKAEVERLREQVQNIE
jgi:uncharacterized protein (TIGR00255 family)